jgi:hypothetical protein
MNIYEYMAGSPIITILLAWCIVGGIRDIWRRTTSLIRVAVRGWPPAHLDADGDWKHEPERDHPSQGDVG